MTREEERRRGKRPLITPVRPPPPLPSHSFSNAFSPRHFSPLKRRPDHFYSRSWAACGAFFANYSLYYVHCGTVHFHPCFGGGRNISAGPFRSRKRRGFIVVVSPRPQKGREKRGSKKRRCVGRRGEGERTGSFPFPPLFSSRSPSSPAFLLVPLPLGG